MTTITVDTTTTPQIHAPAPTERPLDAESPCVDPARVPAERCETDMRVLVRDMLVRLADKWTMLVIEELSAGPLRFTSLMARVPGISHRMLTQTLRALLRDGMVTRTAYAEVPPRVEYELTALGRTLIEPVGAFVQWAHQHHGEVIANRDAFDAI